MDDAANTRIGMFDVIRSTVPLEGYDDDNALQKIPVGSEGTVLEVFGDGEDFLCDFDLFNNPAKPTVFTVVMLTVRADQCELVWKCPRNGGRQG